MTPFLMVGCPLRDRAWILPRWFDHVAIAAERAGYDTVTPVFVGDPDTDPSFEIASSAANDRGWHPVFVVTHEGFTPYERVWDLDRYEQMAKWRNMLLHVVRSYGPEYFWSLDSDILAAPDSLELAIDALCNRDFNAVGQRCYMTTGGVENPSFANLNGGGMLRHDSAGTFLVDVIMAAKVMTPAAYAIDYCSHQMGEDIGWSQNCREAGLKLGWDGRVVSKHVMHVEDLDVVDVRCGF